MQKKSVVGGTSRIPALLEHALVFCGDLLPYGTVFLLTLAVGYSNGLESAGLFSLAYAYVAIVTALVCGPNLLSLRRRMPDAKSAGAVVMAALGLRTTVVFVGALLLMGALLISGTQPGMLQIMAPLFAGRLLETAVDGPATCVQYLRSPRDYFLLRVLVFVLICGITSIGMITSGTADLQCIALSYLLGSTAGLMASLAVARRLLVPILGLVSECQAQATEFGKFFLATLLYLAASRLHPMIVGYFSGHEAAGQFAMVQNLFAALALATTALAGVFFWSRNRRGGAREPSAVPWMWLAGALPGGLLMGAAGGTVMDYLFLRPLDSSTELRTAAWILCLATPFLLAQAILSNFLILLARDRAMLQYSVLNAAVGLLLTVLLVYILGIIGAALAVGASALLSTVIGIRIVRRKDA